MTVRHCSPEPATTSVTALQRHLASSIQTKDNTLQYVHQTSWGMTTRMIGAIIMVHGDNNGLVLPPRIAPTQVMIIPIQQQKEGVLDKALGAERRSCPDFRVKVDDSDKSPGWKFSESGDERNPGTCGDRTEGYRGTIRQFLFAVIPDEKITVVLRRARRRR